MAAGAERTDQGEEYRGERGRGRDTQGRFQAGHPRSANRAADLFTNDLGHLTKPPLSKASRSGSHSAISSTVHG